MGRQIAAARALVGLSQAEVAARANISVPTLKRMEASEGPASGMANNVAAVMHALEASGVLFIEQDCNGPGVRLKDRK
ncbi:helix-turn-helix domain-containing protein [Xanthobacter autotrophicus]|uniref:helix-turn-helix domain-containing protein n=1 Tax=Xanthobacter autotrophicus TaxID=280 RepID=UPI003735EF80